MRRVWLLCSNSKVPTQTHRDEPQTSSLKKLFAKAVQVIHRSSQELGILLGSIIFSNTVNFNEPFLVWWLNHRSTSHNTGVTFLLFLGLVSHLQRDTIALLRFSEPWALLQLQDICPSVLLHWNNICRALWVVRGETLFISAISDFGYAHATCLFMWNGVISLTSFLCKSSVLSALGSVIKERTMLLF